MISMGIDAIRTYMNHIGIPIVNVEVERFENWNTSTVGVEHAYIHTLTARCDSKEFKYFSKFAQITRTDHYPKINNETLLNTIEPLDEFSVYEYDEVVTFDFQVKALHPDDIDKFIKMLKLETQEILYNRFSESFDDDVTDELGE